MGIRRCRPQMAARRLPPRQCRALDRHLGASGLVRIWQTDSCAVRALSLMVRDRLRLHSMRLLWVAARCRLSCGALLDRKNAPLQGAGVHPSDLRWISFMPSEMGFCQFSTVSNPNSTVEQTISHTLQ